MGAAAGSENAGAAPAQLRAAPRIRERQIRLLHAADGGFRRHGQRRRHRLGFVRRHRARRRSKRKQIIDPRFYHTIKEGKNGLGPAPIKTKKGWLHLAHGVRNTAAGMRYVLYLFLCDLKNPAKVIKAPGGYFMAPEGDERVGDVSNVVFCQRLGGARQRRRVHLLRLVGHAHARGDDHGGKAAGLRDKHAGGRHALEDLRRTTLPVDQEKPVTVMA